MATSIVESIFANIKTVINAILAGNTSTGGHVYNYTYLGARVPHWQDKEFEVAKDPTKPIALIRDTAEQRETSPERMGSLSFQITIPILLALQDRRDEKDPFRTTVDEGTTRNQMIADIMAKLAEDDLRGLTANDVTNTEFVAVNRDMFMEGWTLVELIVMVSFRHDRDDPTANF